MAAHEQAIRLVTWNMNTSGPAKWAALAGLNPDIAVLQEVSKSSCETLPNAQWIGNLQSKGLAAVAFDGSNVTVDRRWDSRVEFILPVRVDGRHSLNLLAVWAMGPRAFMTHPDRPKRGQLLQAPDLYADFIQERPCVVAGDFNNSIFWDKEGRPGNHGFAVAELEKLGLVSAYHVAHQVPQGAEADPTLYWTWNRKRPYHIDYVFLPSAWTHELSVTVGSYASWVETGLSDHVPVTVDVPDS